MRKSPLFLALLFTATFILTIVFGLEESSAIAKEAVGSMNSSTLTNLPTLTYNVSGHRLTLPDFSKVSFANLSVDQPGYLQLPESNTLQSWKAGQSLDSILKLGNLDAEGFNVSSLSLNSVQQLSSKPIDLESSSGPVSQLLQAYPDLPFSSFDQSFISKVGVSVPEWKQWTIKEVPRLNQVPIATLSPNLMQSLLGGAMAPADNYFTNVEHGDPQFPTQMFVSGRVTCKNKTVVEAPSAGKPYAYVELTDFEENGPNFGKRWSSGDYQQVKGGCGPLAIINNGMEPTGMSILGLSTFKLVLRNVKEEQAEFWLFLHICDRYPFIGKTCTPFFQPVMPIYSIEHNDVVLLPNIKGVPL